jgi:hypothetical protein
VRFSVSEKKYIFSPGRSDLLWNPYVGFFHGNKVVEASHPSSAEEPYHHCPIWLNDIYRHIVTFWPSFYSGAGISHHTALDSVILTNNEMNFKGRDYRIIRGRVYCPVICLEGLRKTTKYLK